MCLFSFSLQTVPVNGKQAEQVRSWLLGAETGPKNTAVEWHSSEVNICRFHSHLNGASHWG